MSEGKNSVFYDAISYRTHRYTQTLAGVHNISSNTLNKCRPLYLCITRDLPFICFCFSVLFLLLLFLSVHQRRRWVEEGRREAPSKVICNQGNGQSQPVCERVAATRSAPQHSTTFISVQPSRTPLLATLYPSHEAEIWPLIAEDPFRFQARPCRIRGGPNDVPTRVSASTSTHPVGVIPSWFHIPSLFILLGTGNDPMKRQGSIKTQPQPMMIIVDVI